MMAHSPTFTSLYPRHSSFFNPSVVSPTLQVILQPFFRFSHVTGSSLMSPGGPPMSGSIVQALKICNRNLDTPFITKTSYRSVHQCGNCYGGTKILHTNRVREREREKEKDRFIPCLIFCENPEIRLGH